MDGSSFQPVKTCGKCGETKPLASFYKCNNGTKTGLQSYCKACQGATNKFHYEANREKLCAAAKAYCEANPERKRAADKAYREANPDKVNAHTAKRKADKFRATPAWADEVAIARVYKEARDLTQCTGMPHHVDHFYPLKGRKVCGLHVAENLRAIPWRENISKGNRLPEDSAFANA